MKGSITIVSLVPNLNQHRIDRFIMTDDVHRENMAVKPELRPSLSQTSSLKENKKKKIRNEAKKLQELETTPLLCQGRCENNGNYDRAGTTDWEDEEDYAGIVWWKTPSVGL